MGSNFVRAIIVVSTVLTMLAAPAFAQGVNETIKVAGWDVRHVGGDVQSCVAAQTAGDNVVLAFGATTQDKTFVMLIDPTGKWEAGQEYGLEYNVDTGKVYKSKAKASSGTTMLQVVGSINDAGPLFTEVESGDNMHLTTNGVTYDFSLDGSKAALAAVEKCLRAAM